MYSDICILKCRRHCLGVVHVTTATWKCSRSTLLLPTAPVFLASLSRSVLTGQQSVPYLISKKDESIETHFRYWDSLELTRLSRMQCALSKMRARPTYILLMDVFGLCCTKRVSLKRRHTHSERKTNAIAMRMVL